MILKGFKEISTLPLNTKVKLLDYGVKVTAARLQKLKPWTIELMTQYIGSIGTIEITENTIWIAGVPFTHDEYIKVEVIDDVCNDQRKD